MLYHRAVYAFVGRRGAEFDAFDHEGQVLIVLKWFEPHDAQSRKPAIVLPVTSVAHQFVDDPASPWRWVLHGALPEALDQTIVTLDELELAGARHGPDIAFPLAPGRH